MSIINDALKKAQNNLKETKQEKKPDIYKKLSEKQQDYSSQSTPKASPKPVAPIVEAAPVNEKKSWNITFISLIAIFSLFIGVFISFLIVLMNQTPKEIASSPAVQNASPAPVAKKAQETKPAEEKAAPEKTSQAQVAQNPPAPAPANGELVLSGTMMMGDKRVALINNEIYELGEYIDGKKITEITLRNVLLTGVNGEKTLLDVRRKR